MCRINFLLILAAELLLAAALFARGTASLATATCNFDANSRVAIEYQRFGFDFKARVRPRIPYNKVSPPKPVRNSVAKAVEACHLEEHRR
jgi:hypothetical protein